MITVLSESEHDNCYKHNPQVPVQFDTIKICLHSHHNRMKVDMCVQMCGRKQQILAYVIIYRPDFPFTDSTIPGATGFSTFIWTKEIGS